jgi:hypothetical protein
MARALIESKLRRFAADLEYFCSAVGPSYEYYYCAARFELRYSCKVQSPRLQVHEVMRWWISFRNPSVAEGYSIG